MKHLLSAPLLVGLPSLFLAVAAPSVPAQCWNETAQVYSASPRSLGTFGRSIALSGDTLVVGEMYGELSQCPTWYLEPSFVHVFERDLGGAGSWGNALVLANPPQACGWGPTGFGQTVAVDGDTMIVGAPGMGNYQEGAAYVYERDLGGAGNWGQVVELVSSDYLNSYWYGYTVVVSDDTIVVGALGPAAYVYERDQGGPDAWGETKKLAPAGTVLFSHGLDVSGDTIVVGSSYASAAPGEAHVFERNLGGPEAWGESARFSASDGTAGDYFGLAVSLEGDTIFVGAINATSPLGAGAAYVFERNLGGAGAWGEVRKIPAAAGSWSFGWSVSISGDAAVVGNSSPAPDGSVCIYSRDLGGPGAWGEAQQFKAYGQYVGSQFARNVSISGDTVVASAPEASYREWPDVDALAFDPGSGLLYGALEVFGTSAKAMSFDPANGAGMTLGPTSFKNVFGMAFDPGTNTLFATTTKGADQLLTIDLLTGAGTIVGPIGFGSVQGLAFDPLAGVLYGTDRQTDQLITIDVASGNGTAVGYLGGVYGDVRGLAFDPLTSTLFGTARTVDHLIRIDTQTGLAVDIGPLSYSRIESLAFDSIAGTLYGVDRVSDQLLAIDTSTGAATVVEPLNIWGAGRTYVYEFSGTAVNYCTPGVSASGCGATLSSTGFPSATQPSGFSVSASAVSGGRDGLFFFGANGRQAHPWGNGTSFQCVAPPVKRGGLLNGVGVIGTCTGYFSQDLNARWQAKPNQNPGAGATVQAQLWYRDPWSSSNQTTSLSDAIEFCVGS
jgi:hypothetical protein